MAVPTEAISTPRGLKTPKSNRVPYSSKHAKLLEHVSSGFITDFEWKDYCPSAFKLIQELEEIEHDDYMRVICSDETLCKVSSAKPGKSILLSKDDRFVIKVLRKSQIKVITDMLPNYYSHIKKYRASLLTKMYGAHVMKPAGGLKIYFVVLSNILQSNVLMHKCYDLNGSFRSRRSVNTLKIREKRILKDTDLEFRFYIDPLTRHRLLTQIKLDCEFLTSETVMDYSLTLGMHVKGPHPGLFESASTISSESSSMRDSVDSRCSWKMVSVDSPKQCFRSIRTSLLSPNRASCESRFSTPKDCMDMLLENEAAIEIEETVENEFNELTFGDIWLQANSSKLGVKMPVRAARVPKSEMEKLVSRQIIKAYEAPESPVTPDSYEVFLYFGIVDFFHNYGMKKRITRACKSIHQDSKSISAVNPKAYSSWFQDFTEQIFLAEESDQ